MARNVCILLPRVGLYPDLGVMLSETFAGLGWQAAVCHDANEKTPDADLLLVAGFGRRIEGFMNLSRAHGGHKPVTVLWQLEPLPPPQLSALGEEIGGRVAACDWRRISPRVQRVINPLLPFRSRLVRLARWWRARPYSREVIRRPDHEGWREYKVENYFEAMAEWRWIQSARANGWFDFHFASVQPRVEFLRRRGIAAELLPFGYHPRWGRDLQLTRDLDVLFLGKARRGPRGATLRRLQQELAARGRSLQMVESAYGAERERLLNRAKIMVNLLRVPHDFAGMRVLLGAACGTLVVSEACADTGAFVPGQHLAMAEPAQLAGTIEHYLSHDAERNKIAREGHRFVTQDLTLTSVVRKLLDRIPA